MKVFIILLVVALASAVGYLMGTENGRQHRDEVIARFRKESKPVAEAVEDVKDAVAETAEQLGA